MKLANVISEEAKNTGSIIMHREGLFWRVYERSAFMFTLHLTWFYVWAKARGVVWHRNPSINAVASYPAAIFET